MKLYQFKKLQKFAKFLEYEIQCSLFYFIFPATLFLWSMLSEQRKKVARNEKTTHGISYSKNIANFEMFRVLKVISSSINLLLLKGIVVAIYIYIYVCAFSKEGCNNKNVAFFLLRFFNN